MKTLCESTGSFFSEFGWLHQFNSLTIWESVIIKVFPDFCKNQHHRELRSGFDFGKERSSEFTLGKKKSHLEVEETDTILISFQSTLSWINSVGMSEIPL